MKNTLKTLTVVLFFLVLPQIAGAQLPDYQSKLIIEIFPEFPRPNEEVSITAKSFLFDLNKANVAWFVNDRLVKQGVGQKTHKLVLGSAGSVYKIDVVASTPSGSFVEATKTISSAEVDMIWEADSYTPIGYKGKPLAPYGGRIRVIAVPNIYNFNGQKISPQNLVYKWSKDNKVLEDSSGYGKNVLTIGKTFYPSNPYIRLEVSNIDNTIFLQETLTIRQYAPEIILYENNPLLGVLYNRAISKEASITGEEVSLLAEPLFFSRDSFDSKNISFSWKMNDSDLTEQIDRFIVLRVPEESGGSANISVLAKNEVNKLEQASFSSSLLFGGNLENPFSLN
jgi:hypothetical protein